MRSELILAFDTSAAHCAAALVRGGAALARRHEAMPRGQAERLMPMLAEVLDVGDAAWEDLDAVAVCTGPGNFTGLRVAVAAARGLALALGRPALGVTRFEALAAGRVGPVLVSVEAPRGRLFVQALRDGAPDGDPALVALADIAAPATGTLCLGHRAAEIAARFGLRAGAEATVPDPVALARCAEPRLGAEAPRPAPLYLRPPDAAPSAEAAPRILDDA